jgi:DNA-binding MarR family transcriptional regulator
MLPTSDTNQIRYFYYITLDELLYQGSENFEHISSAEKFQLCGYEQNFLTRSSVELESKRLINRERQKDDKRVVLVTATNKGEQKVLQHIKEDEAFLKNLTACLEEKEEKQLIILLQKVIDRVDKLEDPFRE